MASNQLFEMMGNIEVKIDDAVSSMDKVVDEAEKTSNGVVDKFDRAGKALATVFAIDKIIDFGKTAVEASANAQAVQAQFEQVFGDMQDEAKKVVDNMGKSFGMLPNRLTPVFTQLTSKFKGLGIDSDEAMKMAERATTNAADAAAYFDISMEDATSALNSYLNGSTEAGEKIGLFATQTQLANWAVEQGLISQSSEWAKLEEAQKQAIVLDYIDYTYDLNGAMGQSSREAGNYQNVVGNLKQSWQDFLAVVGAPILEALIPILQGVTEGIVWLSEGVQSVIEKYQAWSEQHPILTGFLQAFLVVLSAIAVGFGIYNVIVPIATAVTTAFSAVMALLTSPITLVVLAISALIAIMYTLYTNWSTIGPMLAQVWENIKTWVTTATSTMVESVKTWFSDMWTSITTTVNNIKNDITTGFTNGYNTVKEKVTGMYNSVKEWFGKIPSTIKELWGQAQSFLSGINLWQIGVNIVQGLLNGIKEKWNELTNWVSNASANVTKSIKGVFGIKSPSRVMRDEVGKWIPIGLADGIDKASNYVDKAMDNIANTVSDTRFNVPDVAMATDYAVSTTVQPSQSQQNRNSLLEEAVYLLRKIFDKDTNININGRTLSEEILDDINYLNDLYNNRNTRIIGGVAYP